MKAAELIEKLKELPPDTIVAVTDSSCCGCGGGPVNDIEYRKEDGVAVLDGDRFGWPKR